MKELIKVEEREGIETVDTGGLHEYMEVKTKFNDWRKSRGINEDDIIIDEDVSFLAVDIAGVKLLDCRNLYEMLGESIDYANWLKQKVLPFKEGVDYIKHYFKTPYDTIILFYYISIELGKKIVVLKDKGKEVSIVLKEIEDKYVIPSFGETLYEEYLKERENQYIHRINKINRICSACIFNCDVSFEVFEKYSDVDDILELPYVAKKYVLNNKDCCGVCAFILKEIYTLYSKEVDKHIEGLEKEEKGWYLTLTEEEKGELYGEALKQLFNGVSMSSVDFFSFIRYSGRHSKSKTDNRKQYIYFLHSEHGVKIGKSFTPEKRTSTIGTKLPFTIIKTEVFEVEDMSKAETSLHKYFKYYQLNGEWFNLGDVQLKKARDILEELTVINED